MKNRVPEDPDIGDKKGSQPKKYHTGLSKSTKEKRDAHFKRGSKMDDDNPAAYTPAPGDKEAKTKPSVHTKKFKQMYGEEVTQKQIQDLEKFADRLLQKFNIDIEFTRHFADRMNDDRNKPEIKISELQKLFKKISRQKGKDIRQNPDTEAVLKDIQTDLNLPVVINYDKNKDEFEVINKTIMRKKDFKTSNKVIRYEEIQIDESSEEGLKNKAEKSGVSLGILRQVYKRGVAAWRTGHRPGTTPQQWGMARVNSFLTGGKTRTTADADLWKKVKTQKEEYDKYSHNFLVKENRNMNIFSKYLTEAKSNKETIAKLKKMGGEEAEMAAFLLGQGDMKELNKFIKSLSASDRKKIQGVMQEENVTEASSYDIYHKDFSSAVQHARKQAEKRGYTIDDDEWFRNVASGPRKPSTGKTNSYNIELLDKNGKPTKRRLSMQVYNTGKSYELNMYTEEVELDEAKSDIYHKHMLKALGKKSLPKNHGYTSSIAPNGDFVVQDRGTVVARIKKGQHNLKEQNDTTEKVEMAQTQLHFIGYACDEILEFIRMGGVVEEWYQNKLSKVHSDMEGLHSYIEGEMRRTGMKEETDLDEQRGFKNKAVASKGGSTSSHNRWENAYRKLNDELEKAKKAGDTKKIALINKKKDAMLDKKYPMGEGLDVEEQVYTMISEASQALLNKMRELAGGANRIPTGKAFRELKKRAQDELKKEKSVKKPEPEKKEPSKTSKGKTRTGSADPAEKNIIMQLRKAQDVDGNMDIRISPERTTRLKKSQIDTLLKQHDAITKPRDKRMFIAKLTQALRKK